MIATLVSAALGRFEIDTINMLTRKEVLEKIHDEILERVTRMAIDLAVEATNPEENKLKLEMDEANLKVAEFQNSMKQGKAVNMRQMRKAEREQKRAKYLYSKDGLEKILVQIESMLKEEK